MCRMILATGRVDAALVVRAAVDMSLGRTCAQDAPLHAHPNGWGALWRSTDDGRFRTHRDTAPISATYASSPVPDASADLLVVHARHATRPETHGLGFTHPLVREDADGAWYFFHNGYLPTVHEKLGLEASRFDTAEYFEYLVPAGIRVLEDVDVLEQLAALTPGGTSANAIAVRGDTAYVVHWTREELPTAAFYVMYRAETADTTYVSSDPVPLLAPRADWHPLPARSVLEVSLPATRSRDTVPSGR
jgi:glutamine amidotransferase